MSQVDYVQSINDTVHKPTADIDRTTDQFDIDVSLTGLTSLSRLMRRAKTHAYELDALRSSLVAPPQVPKQMARRFVDDALDFDAIWDGIKGSVEGLINSFESLICTAMQCSSYCSNENNGCNDDGKLGDCIQGGIFFLVKGMFGCDQNTGDLFECITDPIISFVLDLLQKLLDYLLQMIDMFGKGLSGLLGIGDVMKMIACESCAMVTLATGVLADFVDDFEVQTCTDILDKGTEQCDKWGLGNIADEGAAVFENMLPLLKISFGLLQCLPAFAEMVIELSVFLGETAIELFPDLFNDAFDIIMFFITADDIISSIETMMQAFDEAWTEVEESGLFGGGARRNGQGGKSFSDLTSGAVSVPSEPTGTTFVHDTAMGTGCFGSASDLNETAATVGCGLNASLNAYSGRTAGNESASKRSNTTGAIAAQSGVVDTSSEMAMDLAECGCAMPVPSCSLGAGEGNCRVQEGQMSLDLYNKRQEAELQTQRMQGVPKEQWEHCADVEPPFIQVEPTKGAANNEMQKSYNMQKRCFIWHRKSVSGGYINNLKLDSLKQKVTQSVIDNPSDVTDEAAKQAMSAANMAMSWWPFIRFSKQDGSATRLTDPDINLDEFAYSFEPSNSEIHRRRRTDAGRRLQQTAYSSHVMGVAEFYTDDTNLTDDRAQVRQHLRQRNMTYADEQFRLLKQDSVKLVRLLTRAHTYLQKNPLGRRILSFGTGQSGSMADAADRVTCGITSTDDNGELVPPSTYPCCDGLWCCIRPPFKRSFRIKKEWFIWQDRWVTDTQCPEMNTFVDGWLFLIRAFFKLIRGGTDNVGPIWPMLALSDQLLSFTTFPGDKWPQELEHPGESHLHYTLQCIGLNSGIWISSLLVLYVLYSQLQKNSIMRDLLGAHIQIFADAFTSEDTLPREINPDGFFSDDGAYVPIPPDPDAATEVSVSIKQPKSKPLKLQNRTQASKAFELEF
jgi:hypothetical protein